jgi:hypothetical protein
MVRGAYSAASVIGRARERYLGAGEEESLAGAPGRRPQRADLGSLSTPQRSRRHTGRRSVPYVWPLLLPPEVDENAAEVFRVLLHPVVQRLDVLALEKPQDVLFELA